MRPDPAIFDFLETSGLVPAGETPQLEPMGGGVSSDIWLVHRRAGRSFCVKRALPKLRVAAEWLADVKRNASEVAWLRQVAAMNHDAVPAVLADDAALGVFAMEYLPPGEYELWKTQLAKGVVNVETAATVGERLAAIHQAFALSDAAPREFDTGPEFHSLRLEPYLLATARVHTDLASALEGLAARTAATKRTVVHGDVSPKNILLGPRGPVFLDAECAWWGDPAFDLAFCLNHLLLKTVWVPAARDRLMKAFETLAAVYFRGVAWEPPGELESRASSLLPGLLLARIDGKSPVEYLTDEPSKDLVRRHARAMLADPPERLIDIRRRWTGDW